MPGVEASFPEPLVFPPLSGIHKHTIILLHGRGSKADAFGPELLSTPIRCNRELYSAVHSVQPPTSLVKALPNAKFVFPTARKQRATVYKRSIIRQWFDDWHLSPMLSSDIVGSWYDDGLQITSLGETITYLHGLIAEEAKCVGSARNVIIGGISQGATASFLAALFWEGDELLGGVVGICGWLPYMKQIADASTSPVSHTDDQDSKDETDWTDQVGGFDPFERQAFPGHRDENREMQTLRKGVSELSLDWLREEIELPVTHHRSWYPAERGGIPSILCHGLQDEKVDIERSKQASAILPTLGLYPIEWKAYEDVGHTYSGDMLVDILAFLQRVLG